MSRTTQSLGVGRARRALVAIVLAAAAAGSCGGEAPDATLAKAPSTAVSSSLALTSDDGTLWVVNPDADSVSVLDPKTRKLIAEIPLRDDIVTRLKLSAGHLAHVVKK